MSGGAISAFRGIRLLRVFKLARSWKSFQEMLVKIGKTVKDISNFSVLLFLFMFVYCLLGMELFGHKVHFND
jgi:voltage-dependent calcium channel L type alpha-1D